MKTKNIKGVAYSAIAILFLCIITVYAFVDKPRIVTRETLPGIWEAISDRDYRVFQLEIHENGEGYLIYAVQNLDDAYVYKLTNIQIGEKDGVAELKLEFISDDNRKIEMQGTGWRGCLKVQLDKDPSGSPNIWNLEFYKVPGDQTYVELLYKLSQKASIARKAQWNKSQELNK